MITGIYVFIMLNCFFSAITFQSQKTCRIERCALSDGESIWLSAISLFNAMCGSMLAYHYLYNVWRV